MMAVPYTRPMNHSNLESSLPRGFAERPALRVLFVSGYVPDEDLLADNADHVVEYLAKPVTSERLQRKVAALLDPLLDADSAGHAAADDARDDAARDEEESDAGLPRTGEAPRPAPR